MERIFVPESFLEFCGNDLEMASAQINLTIKYLNLRFYSNDAITEKDIYEAFGIPWPANKEAARYVSSDINYEAVVDANAENPKLKFALKLDFVDI